MCLLRWGAIQRNERMTELELIIGLHKNSARQGPGSENDTLKALDFFKLPTIKEL